MEQNENFPLVEVKTSWEVAECSISAFFNKFWKPGFQIWNQKLLHREVKLKKKIVWKHQKNASYETRGKRKVRASVKAPSACGIFVVSRYPGAWDCWNTKLWSWPRKWQALSVPAVLSWCCREQGHLQPSDTCASSLYSLLQNWELGFEYFQFLSLRAAKLKYLHDWKLTAWKQEWWSGNVSCV